MPTSPPSRSDTTTWNSKMSNSSSAVTLPLSQRPLSSSEKKSKNQNPCSKKISASNWSNTSNKIRLILAMERASGSASLGKIWQQLSTTISINSPSSIWLSSDTQCLFSSQDDHIAVKLYIPLSTKRHKRLKILPSNYINPIRLNLTLRKTPAFELEILTQIRLLQYLKYNKFFYSYMEESDQLSMKDFEVVKELGSGSFGRVRLVKKKEE